MATLFDQRTGTHDRRFRRGIYLLPSLFTVGNMFCGYACIVYAMRGDLTVAAPFIGIAFVLDALDGRIARLTGTTSAFGVELDSLADVISFGIAPAVLTFAWGLGELGRVGWAAGFIYLSAAAMRLARFNIQTTTATPVDKRYLGRHAESRRGGGRRRHRVRLAVHPWRLPARPSRDRRGARAGVPDGQHDSVPQLQVDQLRMAAVLHAAVRVRRAHHAHRHGTAVSRS